MEKEEMILVVERVAKAVAGVYGRESMPLAQMRGVVLLVREALAELRAAVLEQGFRSVEEEIHFFKVVWPGVYSWQVYAADRFAVDVRRPVDEREKVIGYLREELNYVQKIFLRSPVQFAYFRQGMEGLDGAYFLGEGKRDVALEGLGVDADGQFAAPWSYLWAKFMAGERLRDELLAELAGLEIGIGLGDRSVTPAVPVRVGGMRWTGEKVNLIELAHSLFVSGQIENGKVGITEFFERMGRCFEIDLGIPKRGFDDLSSRKRLSRTHFLEVLQEGLNKKFDDADAFDPVKGR
ncbi:RteC domain-containing protein [Pedobacter sp. ISL-68]|uniref:RteC domain-containing protein n=1 Tax=unclassified Pedobacter TaxID=2628915 RepID=UPI001BE835BB|nr:MULTISPECIES: RteC domain-containing protein [unclassified Pedobacter]MBT2563766.1 RteC domain-containing protein [Pedobacter sp. ISL-64]MBT2589658.1 RteC domain-containing protein [Pedobacter sp. ISL-68]